MGVLLSKPNTDKEYDEGENNVIAYAACSMQVRACNPFPASLTDPASGVGAAAARVRRRSCRPEVRADAVLVRAFGRGRAGARSGAPTLTAPWAATLTDETRDEQGWRTSMEDAHCAELDVDGKGSAFFGVYDGEILHMRRTWVDVGPVGTSTKRPRLHLTLCRAGHAGTDVAIYISRFLHKNCINDPDMKVQHTWRRIFQKHAASS
jgi:hypothetical protein